MESRKRLYPWLRKNINEENFGLRWVDREKLLFRIPWVHKHSRIWNKEYVQVFKEWAKVTHKYSDGELEDWPGWKTRLRTALTKLPYFEEIHCLHKLDIDKPYKVYKILSKERETDNSDASSSAASSPNSSQPAELSPNVSPYSPPPQYFDALSPSFKGVDSDFPNQDLNGFNGEAENRNLEGNAGQEHGAWNISITSQVANGENDMKGVQIDWVKSEEMRSLPSDLRSLDSGNLVYQKTPVMDYKIYYLNEIVKEGKICDMGAHFYFGELFSAACPDNDKLVGPQCLERIEFPDVTNINRSLTLEQQKLIQDVLLKMDRGFSLLYGNDRNIYAKRLCRTRVFALDFSSENSSLLLDRKCEQVQKLFDEELYRDKVSTKPPLVLLTFAQEYSPLDGCKKLLMYMEVNHLEALEQHQKLCPPGSKDIPQFSDFDSHDKYIDALKKLSLHE